MAVKKYLDLVGLQNYNQTVLVDTIRSLLSYDSTNNKFVSTSFSRGQEGNAGKVIKGAPADVIAVTTSVTENSGDLVTSGGVYSAIQGITEPMIFKGGVTLTADSTDTTKCSLTITDPASATNIKKGFTYKVTTIASTTTYTGTIKVGDTLIAAKNGPDVTPTWGENTDWTIVPSGDEPSGTVTNVAVSKKGIKTDQTDSGPITTSGTISLALADDSTALSGNVYNVGLDGTGNLAVSVPTASDTALGLVKVDTTNGISLDGSNKLSVNVDGTTILNTNGTIGAKAAGVTDDGSTRTPYLGVVKVDDTTIKVDGNGTISAATATSNAVGVVKPGDNISVDSNGALTTKAATYDDDATPVSGTVKIDSDTLDLTNNVVSIITITSGQSGESTNEIAALFA